FYGQLGAGKTTFIKQLCVMLGVTDNISSPTYPIINEYSTLSGRPVFHMDLYRLDSEEAAVRIGLEEYLESGNICLIEWADNFESLLPEQHIKIFIRKLEDDIRSIDIRTSFP
ncbi:MAG TPA: tRNA (adenosine(37)-N6)-threonylcarbamoyltransferase complex ATPase subunit type 1 TsaE, partial [Chitinophagales bacterium]|nr:tRNA (adenosine(37)-N6)-threonylcarbamoyltransferase complex ATPase subunit type 1 TsaE [Chitinophagales bacterium]